MAESIRVRERDFERFLTFVDAVVAIAMTLLVLPLVDIANQLGNGSVNTLLEDHQAQIYGFVLSFFVISSFWFTQHRLMHNVVAHDPMVNRLMVIWLFTIVLLPFPTALVAQQGHQAATKILYIGTMALSAAVLAGLSWRIQRTPAIRDSGEVPNTRAGVLTAGTLLVALATTLVFPATGYWPLLLLLLMDNGAPILRQVRRWPQGVRRLTGRLMRTHVGPGRR